MKSGPVERAARSDLRKWGLKTTSSALAQDYLLLARQLDTRLLEPRDVAAISREFRLIRQELSLMATKSEANALSNIDDKAATKQ